MASYPYFAATLRTLLFDAPPPCSEEDFLAAAGEALNARDRAALFALANGAPSAHPWVARWRAAEVQLANAVARCRLARRADGGEGLVGRPHVGWRCDVDRGVEEAFREKDPLRRHRALIQLRWVLAEEMAGFDFCSSDAVFSYFIRLRLSHDLARPDAEKGAQRLRAVAQGTEKEGRSS